MPPDEFDNDNETPETTGAQPDARPTPPAAPTPPSGTTVDQSQLASIKQRARAAGRREATQAMEQKFSRMAKLLGFSSLEELENTDPEEWRQRQTQGARQPAERQQQPGSGQARPAAPKGRGSRALEKENARLLEEKKRLTRIRVTEERKRKALERELAAKEAETELRIAAIRAGVQDVDYALTLLRREMKAKSPQEIAAFNEDEFFATNLRRTHPFLYATEIVPATTAPAGNEVEPPKPPTAPPSAKTGEGGPVDAKKMSREEYIAMLKKKGLTDPSVGMPS